MLCRPCVGQTWHLHTLGSMPLLLITIKVFRAQVARSRLAHQQAPLSCTPSLLTHCMPWSMNTLIDAEPQWPTTRVMGLQMRTKRSLYSQYWKQPCDVIWWAADTCCCSVISS